MKNLLKKPRSLVLLLVAVTLSGVASLSVSGCGGGGAAKSPTVPAACSDCGGQPTATEGPLPDSIERVATFSLYPGPDGSTPRYYDADGRAVSQRVVVTAFKKLPKDPNKAIELQVLSQPPSQSSGAVKPSAVSVGCIWMDIRWDTSGHVACINRNGPHLHFHIRNKCKNQEIFNLHCMGWKDNGPQFGLYESASGRCFKSTGKWTAIRDQFMGAFAVVGITGTTAYILSEMATATTIGAFAL